MPQRAVRTDESPGRERPEFYLAIYSMSKRIVSCKMLFCQPLLKLLEAIFINNKKEKENEQMQLFINQKLIFFINYVEID